jgi:hypothetical protein
MFPKNLEFKLGLEDEVLRKLSDDLEQEPDAADNFPTFQKEKDIDEI